MVTYAAPDERHGENHQRQRPRHWSSGSIQHRIIADYISSHTTQIARCNYLKSEFLEFREQIRAHAVRIVRLEVGHVHEIRSAQLQQPPRQRCEAQELLIALGRDCEKDARDWFKVALDAELQTVVENQQLVDQLHGGDVTKEEGEKNIYWHDYG
jgi:hypothetical protein